jgi:hypothetical protein
VTALVLTLMRAGSDLIWGWAGDKGPVVVFAVVLVGGGIVALLRHREPSQDFDGQLREGEGDRPTPSAAPATPRRSASPRSASAARSAPKAVWWR